MLHDPSHLSPFWVVLESFSLTRPVNECINVCVDMMYRYTIHPSLYHACPSTEFIDERLCGHGMYSTC